MKRKDGPAGAGEFAAIAAGLAAVDQELERGARLKTELRTALDDLPPAVTRVRVSASVASLLRTVLLIQGSRFRARAADESYNGDRRAEALAGARDLEALVNALYCASELGCEMELAFKGELTPEQRKLVEPLTRVFNDKGRIYP